ncbi:MAG: DUF6134 family protein [Chitinophagales bacterium]
MFQLKKHFFILVFLLLNTSLVFAQKNAYRVIFFGDSVGLITVEKKVVNNQSFSCHFKSEAEAVLFFIKTKTFAQTDLVFSEAKLVSGHVIRKKNNELQELFYKWNGTSYDVTDNNKKLNINKEIIYATANFFIKEPIGIDEVFVERFNYFVPIEKLENNQYRTKVDGGTNLYTYKKGKLVSLKSTKGVSILMELIK